MNSLVKFLSGTSLLKMFHDFFHRSNSLSIGLNNNRMSNSSICSVQCKLAFTSASMNNLNSAMNCTFYAGGSSPD